MNIENLGCFVENHWTQASNEGVVLKSAVDSRPLAASSSDGVNFEAIAAFAKDTGGSNLRKMTFHERALMLKSLAQFLNERKDAYYELSTDTGATRNDSWIDIDGGISTLFVYSSKGRRELPNDRVLPDGEAERISRNGTFTGQHIYLPLRGVAVHINAYNFPCWGMLEKLAPTLLAGVPAIVKPATSTSFLTERMVRDIIDSNLLPAGALQLVCGRLGDLFEHLTCQDVIAFTGSKATADYLRQHPNVIAQSIRFSAETDSLNCSILGPEARADSPEFGLFVDEVVKEMSTKAGQKCTAIRRLIVPESMQTLVQNALADRLDALTIGHPGASSTDMGPLASLAQREEVDERVVELATESDIVYQREKDWLVHGANKKNGAFISPVLLKCDSPLTSSAPHQIEAFGPVATLLPYANTDAAIALANKGDGSLVGSLFSNDDAFAAEIALGAGSYHGRLMIVNRHCAGESTGHGSPLPHLVHGGPGRAGGGEELGGIRAVKHYMQRTALQGSPTTISAITRHWLDGADTRTTTEHPFRKTFEDLTIGDCLNSKARTMTSADIEAFASLTGDTFYAHMDADTAARNPFFDGQVAHGYFIVSAAAGLFVESEFGPVLANYGLDNLRFATPVNVGDSLSVRLVCKQKTYRDSTGYGEVRWDARVTNQSDEVVATYDVLTMVAGRDLMTELTTN